MHTHLDGFPNGTVTIPQPATCPELADIYNAPLCAFDHELTYIPMQLDLRLAETGSELFPVVIALGIILVAFILLTYAMWRNRDRRFVSLDCRGGQHNACEKGGSCDGCQCHEVNA